jgi:hypothetical protein
VTLRLVTEDGTGTDTTEHQAIDCAFANCERCGLPGEATALHDVTWRLCYGCNRCWTSSFIEHPTEKDALDFADMIREAARLLSVKHVWDDQHGFWRPVEPGWAS